VTASSAGEGSAGARITSAILSKSMLTVTLADGRVLSVPLWWYPRLYGATPAQRRNWRLTAGGTGLHWPDLDEDVSTDGLLAGIPARDAARPRGGAGT
jgi:hypothetical protein